MNYFASRTAAIFLLLATASVWAQHITQSQIDSGWVSLFDGKSLNGFYSVNRADAPNYDLANHPDGIFTVRPSDSVIRSEGLTTAHLLTKKIYSHYRVRVRVKYDKLGDEWLNSGMLYHAHIEAPRLYGTYPRSIEFQGQKRGMGEAWTIGKVYVNTTVDAVSLPKHKYQSGGQPVVHGGGDPDRQCLGSSNPFLDGAWNEMEALVRGSDSSVHIVNGKTVFRCSKIRWSDAFDPNDMSHMLMDGSLGLQVEGDSPSYVAPISYKDFMIMELDPGSGMPLHGKPVLVRVLPPSRMQVRLRSEPASGGWNTRSGYVVLFGGKNGLKPFAPHALDGRAMGFQAIVESLRSYEMESGWVAHE